MGFFSTEYIRFGTNQRHKWIVFGVCLFVIGLVSFKLSQSNVLDPRSDVAALATLVHQSITDNRSGYKSRSRSTSFPVDILAPCGEVCFYKGKNVSSSKAPTPYQQITKNIDCENIMRRMAYRHHNITYPPLRNIPSDLLDAFTQDGAVIVQPKAVYYNNVKSTHKVSRFTNASIQNYLDKLAEGININSYKDSNCTIDLVRKYSKKIIGRKGAVIGTRSPWLESMLLFHGAKHVSTLEYSALKYDDPRLSFFTPYSYAEKYLRGETKPFEFAATFSSLEHSGLGRYGDPINPYGDMEAMAQMWCMLKPGGIFIVGIPGNLKPGSHIVWNAHRIYGLERLPHITASWDLMEAKQCTDGHHHLIMVLTKPY